MMFQSDVFGEGAKNIYGILGDLGILVEDVSGVVLRPDQVMVSHRGASSGDDSMTVYKYEREV